MARMIDIPFNEYLVFFFFVSPKRTILIFVKTNLYRDKNLNWKQLLVIDHLLRLTNKQTNKQTRKKENTFSQENNLAKNKKNMPTHIVQKAKTNER
jgi:hypothetical protein